MRYEDKKNVMRKVTVQHEGVQQGGPMLMVMNCHPQLKTASTMMADNVVTFINILFAVLFKQATPC